MYIYIVTCEYGNKWSCDNHKWGYGCILAMDSLSGGLEGAVGSCREPSSHELSFQAQDRDMDTVCNGI